ncbi:hypothetical protein BSKO_00983 [Bryopsis sp. KO-2023]|nr:hypothetical protein BSKO_00983 [Bryopsis sp. KO-2023]
MNTGPSAFKKLVRVTSRKFYAGPCPPKENKATARGKWERVDTSGLGIVVLDSLTQKEWVKEDLLADELKIAPKLLRRALRYLEVEKILRREHRKEGKRTQNKDVVVLATKEKDDGVEEQPVKARLHSYCAIDYPRFMDMLNLRMHLIKQKLKSELEEENPVMNYICPTCNSTFSSLDFALLLDRDTGQMCCDECGTEVLEQFGADGQTGNADDRRKRREGMRSLSQAFEKDAKDIFDQLVKVKGIEAPDYGSLTDWAVARRAAEAARARDGGKGEGGAGADGSWEPTVELDFGGPSTEDPVKTKSEDTNKGLPPWMLRQGIKSESELASLHSDANLDSKDEKIEGMAVDNDAKFKQYVDEIKRKHAYATAMRAAQKRPADEEVKQESPGAESARPGKKPKVDPSTNEKAATPPKREKKAESDDGIEWEDDGGGVEWEEGDDEQKEVEWEDGQDDGDGDNDGAYDAEAAEAARIADMESDAARVSGWTQL